MKSPSPCSTSGPKPRGRILAKNMGFGFIDTDVLIQTNQQKTLQMIINETDHLNLRELEEETILQVGVDKYVIATGGSVVYSDKAMAHLQRISKIVFLEVRFDELKRRIKNFSTRGIAKTRDQTFADLYRERQILYKKYADATVDCNMLSQAELAELIESLLLP